MHLPEFVIIYQRVQYIPKNGGTHKWSRWWIYFIEYFGKEKMEAVKGRNKAEMDLRD